MAHGRGREQSLESLVVRVVVLEEITVLVVAQVALEQQDKVLQVVPLEHEQVKQTLLALEEEALEQPL